jgi:predicted kinase
MLIVSCNADREVLSERIERRRAGGGDASDAGIGVLDWQLQSADPLTPAEKTRCIAVNTAAPNSVADALSVIAMRCPS